MTKIAWLCLISIVLLSSGSAYHLHSGKISAGPFEYSRAEQPTAFYVTLVAIFIVGLVAVAYVWGAYG